MASQSKPNKRGKKQPHITAEVIQVLHEKGFSEKEIAEIFGVTDRTIRKRIKGLGLFKQGPPKQQYSEAQLKQVEQLASIGCPEYEIADILGIGKTKFDEWKKNSAFAGALKKGQGSVKKSLRQMQIELALGIGEEIDAQGNKVRRPGLRTPDRAMLIWLGKQILGQRDDPGPIETDEIPGIAVLPAPQSMEEWQQMVQKVIADTDEKTDD